MPVLVGIIVGGAGVGVTASAVAVAVAVAVASVSTLLSFGTSMCVFGRFCCYPAGRVDR